LEDKEFDFLGDFSLRRCREIENPKEELIDNK